MEKYMCQEVKDILCKELLKMRIFGVECPVSLVF